jgi:hypothetical protein
MRNALYEFDEVIEFPPDAAHNLADLFNVKCFEKVGKREIYVIALDQQQSLSTIPSGRGLLARPAQPAHAVRDQLAERCRA